MIMHMILGKTHLTSQGIGQQHSHMPFLGLEHDMSVDRHVEDHGKNQQFHRRDYQVMLSVYELIIDVQHLLFYFHLTYLCTINLP